LMNGWKMPPKKLADQNQKTEKKAAYVGVL
jgi:hypothetical protein